MGTDGIKNLWDLEESPTLRLVGAYLDGVADAMASLVREPSAPAAAEPAVFQSQAIARAVEAVESTGVRALESALESAPVESSPRHITLRFGGIALPLETTARPPSAGDRLEPTRGGSRLLNLEHPSTCAYSVGGPWRETLPYSAPALTVSPSGPVSSPSLWPEERNSGVRLQLPDLSPAWFALTGTD